MKKYLWVAVAALLIVGCSDKEAMPYETPVSGHSYVDTKYHSEELHFDSRYNKVLLVEHTESGKTLRTNQFYLMKGDTISTYNNTSYSDYREKFIYCGTYLKNYHGGGILEETK